MANRHILRSTAMQVLYQIDIIDRWQDDAIWDYVTETLARLSANVTDTSYIKEVVAGVMGNRQSIDDMITRHANGWTMETIAPVERNVLRVAVYEMTLYQDEDVPMKVSINEAIEIAKHFSGSAAGKFINGILGGLYKEINPDESIQ